MKVIIEDEQKKLCFSLLQVLSLPKGAFKDFPIDMRVSAPQMTYFTNVGRSGGNAPGQSVVHKLLKAFQHKISTCDNETTKVKAKLIFRPLAKNFGIPIKEDIAPTIVPPGAVLYVDAVNHVKRDCDDELIDFLSNQKGLIAFLVGGVQSGTTSSLVQLVEQSKQAGNAQVVVDFSRLPEPLDIYQFIGNDFDASIACSGTLSKELLGTSPKKAALFFDNVDLLSDVGTEHSTLFHFLTWIRGLLTDHENAVAFLAFSGKGWSADLASVVLTRGKRIPLLNFSENQVEELLTAYAQDTATAKAIYNYTLGQPHLSHLAVEKISQGEDIENILENANDLRGEFYSHWLAVKTLLTASYTKKPYILLNIIELVRNSEELALLNLTDAGFSAADLEPMLDRLCLFEGTKKRAQIACFYRNAIISDTDWHNELEDLT